jgi:uncharacterized BrkB/YihY/UPF0761 family membrane protein
MDFMFSPFLIAVVAIVGVFTYSIVRSLAIARIRELEVRERIAMIERGLVPPPEKDPQGFDRAMNRYDRLRDRDDDADWYPRRRASARYRTAGVTLMGVGFGLMLMIGLLAATAAQIIEARWFANVSLNYPALAVMRGGVIRSALILLPALVFGLIYYFVPNVKVMVKDVWLGGLITGLLWDAGFKGFSWFVRDVSRFTRIHGSIATVIVFLFWIYFSAVILLWGVEFTASYSKIRRDIRAAGARTNE